MKPISYSRRAWASLLLLIFCGAALAQGLPSQTWPAGTHLSTWNHGGRINTFHRGYLYLGGLEGQGTHIYNIANPQSPQLLHSDARAVNGHTWHKIGDLFYRQYWNPEVGSDPPEGTSQFMSLANPLNRVPWTQPIHNFPVQTRVWGGGFMSTYPYWFADRITDARIGWWPPAAEVNVDAMAGIGAGNKWRIGNLLFFTPGDDQTGIAVFDIGDPLNPVLLDVLAGNYRQYTTAWQVYRHYLVMMIGDNTNGPDSNANTLIIDFSDPTNLHIEATLPYESLPGRYVHFQDNFAFAGRGNRGVKFDMETRTIVREFNAPGGNFFGDFQWLPLGHLLLVSSSETNGSQSHLFTHVSGLDTTAPTVGYHLPVPNAVNQPVDTAIGLVIHEILDANTVNDTTIDVRPLGGDPIDGIVIQSSYNVINFHPAEPLLEDTTYEVTLVGGGIQDVAGNAIAPYSFRFSTGASIGGGGIPEIQSLTQDPASPVQTAQAVTFTATATVDGGGTLDYRWDFGDGSAVTAWSPTASSVAHAFNLPGTYTVQVQVRGPSGEVASATRTLVVRNAVLTLAARSTPIQVHPTRREVFVANPDHGNVAVIGADSMQRLAEIPVGTYPQSLAFAANGHVWVANRDSDSLSRIDPASRTVVQTVELGYGTRPAGVVIQGAVGYVALSGPGTVRRFDAGNGALGPIVAVGAHPHALALASDGSMLYVSRLISDGSDGEIARIALPAFSTASITPLPLDSTTPDSGTAARGMPNYVGALALSGDGSRLWYGAKKDNVLRGSFREGTTLTFETSMRALIGRLNTATGNEQLGQRMDLDNATRPSALLLSPGDSHLFVALEGNHRVAVISPWQRSQIVSADVGFAPQGLAFDVQTGRLFVQNFLSRSVSVLDAGALLAQGSASLPQLAVVASSATEPLSATVLDGKRVFYSAEDVRMAQDGYFSCAMCHLDGRQDGRVWDFTQLGEGLRNTTSLRGTGGMGIGRVHWSGNFDEIQDFEGPIRNLFGGIGFMDDADFFDDDRSNPLGAPKAGYSAELDALAAYVGSLTAFDRSPYRSADGGLTADGVAGRAVFEQLDCQRCHSGADFSDSDLHYRHDVGTLSAGSGGRLGAPLVALDTPSLRGVWDSAPYLHDGRAADLESVFSAHNPGGVHGDTASLSPTEFSQLISFLRQIDGSEPATSTAPQLQLTSPEAGAVLSPGELLDLSISTNLPDIQRVDYRVNGQIVASSAAAPWSAQWPVESTPGRAEVQAHAYHDDGRFNTLSAEVGINAGCSGSGHIHLQRYNNIPGSSLADLRASPAFPDSPHVSSVTTELFESPQDAGEDYGLRMRALLCAPQTGNYTFWIAGDDNVELNLSSDANPDNTQRIAWHDSWTNLREWGKFATQQSTPVALEAGRWYYIEALMKEGFGGDHVSVGWRLPDNTLERPIPASSFSLISAALGDRIFDDGFQP